MIASRCAEYARIQGWVELYTHAMESVLECQGLESALKVLLSFAGDTIYGTPGWEQDIEELFVLVQADMEHVFDLIWAQGGFDPW